MSTQIKTSGAYSAPSVYPEAMRVYISRVLADGGIIGSIGQTYRAFHTAERLGVTANMMGVGPAFGYKVNGSGHVTKLYDLLSASFDQTPNTAAAQSTVAVSDGRKMLTIAPGLTSGVHGAFKSANGFTDITSHVSMIAAFSLTNPTSLTSQLVSLERVTNTQRRLALQNSATGGQSRLGSLGWYAGGITQLPLSRRDLHYPGVMTTSIWAGYFPSTGGGTDSGHVLYIGGPETTPESVPGHRTEEAAAIGNQSIVGTYSTETLYPVFGSFGQPVNGKLNFALYLKGVALLDHRAMHRAMR